MQPLRFRSDGTFTIVQLTDLHISDGSELDLRTLSVAGQILDTERPDLVMFTGDMLSGWETKDAAAAMRLALSPATERQLPFGFVFGNHDDEGNLNRKELFEVIRKLPGCLMQAGPSDLPGVGNYLLPIDASVGSETAGILHCFDSHSYSPQIPDKGRPRPYAWITESQSQWHRDMVRSMEAGRDGLPPLPALAFFHIPLPEYDTVWDTMPCTGYKWEAVSPPTHNSGFFTTLVKAGQVLGTFVGHDHINDYEGELNGIRLCFGRGGSFKAYSREGYLKGARVIRLREATRTFDTWIRLEDGSLAERPLHQP